MQSKRQNTLGKKPKLTLKIIRAITLITACGFVGSLALGNINSRRQDIQLGSIALDFGYSPDAELTRYEICGGIFPVTCQRVLYFTTHQSTNDIQVRVENLLSTEKKPHPIDGYSMINVNLESRHSFSINGYSDPVDRTRMPEPLAYEWLFENDGMEWAIILYAIANDGAIYKFDGKQISGNIVAIILKTR